MFDGSDCTGECIDPITITRGNYISSLDVFYQSGGSESLDDLTISFSRPSSSAEIKSSTSFSSAVSYVQISIASPKSANAKIKIYLSGRIQVN